METNLFNIKHYLQDGAALDQDALIPLFHEWIRDGLISDDVMIDVADYRHVHEGPGVMLICHEAHYAMSESEGRPGVMYSRKRGESEGDLSSRLRAALTRSLLFCEAVEKATSLDESMRFNGGELLFQVGSRLALTNTEEDYQSVREPLQAFFDGLYGEDGCSLSREGNPRDCLTIRVKSTASVNVATLLERVR